MAAETSGKIEEYQVEYIINAIANCCTLPRTKLELKSKNTETNLIPQLRKHTSDQSFSSSEISSLSGRLQTLATMAAQSPKKNKTNPSLAHLLQRVPEDSRLMVRLGKNSPHKEQHPFLLQKKANDMLPQNVIVRKVAHINTEIALIPATGTSIQQLEEYSNKLARAFGVYQAKRNEQWVKYLVEEVLRHIKTYERLTDISVEIVEQALEISCSMRSEWGR